MSVRDTFTELEPAFFCEVISIIYRSKDDKREKDESDEAKKDILAALAPLGTEYINTVKKAFAEHYNKLTETFDKDIDGALISLGVRTGEIKALVCM